jgi:16S rRNA (guanine527-N7)-methyltransferase
MSTEIPHFSEAELSRRLSSLSPVELGEDALHAMAVHYEELRRWAPRMALIGSGMGEGVLERLFGESLAALPLLSAVRGVVVDVGSGGGFPGLVIAAARPDLRVVLIEPRQKKWAFLRAVVDKAALSCTCVNARVAAALPAEVPPAFDQVTVRALRLGRPEIRALTAGLSPGGAVLLWASDGIELPQGLREVGSVDLGVGRGRIARLIT